MIPPPRGLTETDFDLIHSAVMETERGRWFLAEFSRRCRGEDTRRILAAIEGLAARAYERESDRLRARIDNDRTAELMLQLAEIVKDLRPATDARVRSQSVNAIWARPAETQTGLERRFAALVHLDEMDVEQKLNLFG